MDNLKDLSNSAIFPKGEKIENGYFIGATWLEAVTNEEYEKLK